MIAQKFLNRYFKEWNSFPFHVMGKSSIFKKLVQPCPLKLPALEVVSLIITFLFQHIIFSHKIHLGFYFIIFNERRVHDSR